MADQKEYTLHIDVNNIKSDKEKAKDKIKEAAGQGKKEKKEKDPKTATMKLFGVEIGETTNIAGAMVYDAVKQSVSKVASVTIQGHATSAADTTRAIEINNMMNTAGSVVSLTTSTIAGGAIAGTTGAAIAAVTGLVTRGIQMYESAMQYLREEQQDKLSTNRKADRLGILASDRNR